MKRVCGFAVSRIAYVTHYHAASQDYAYVHAARYRPSSVVCRSVSLSH